MLYISVKIKFCWKCIYIVRPLSQEMHTLNSICYFKKNRCTPDIKNRFTPDSNLNEDASAGTGLQLYTVVNRQKYRDT